MAADDDRWGSNGDSAQPPIFMRDPMGMLRRRWRVMLLVFVCALCASVVAVLLLVEALYVGSSTVLVTGQQIPESFVQPTVEQETSHQIEAMVGEMLARDRIARILEDHDLFPELRRTAPLQEVVAHFRSRVRVVSEQGVSTKVRRGQPSSLYRVTFAHEKRKVAAAVANDLTSIFVTSAMRMRTEQARLTTEFMRKQLAEAEGALRAQEAEIARVKELARGALPSELESNLRRLERLQAQRQSLALQIGDAESRLALLAASPSISPESPEARLAALRSRLAEQLAVHTPEHPNVLSLRRQVESLEKEVASGGGAGAPTRRELLAGARRQVDQLRAQLIDTEAGIRLADEMVALTPANQEKLTAMEQKAEVLRTSYTTFLQKVKDAELAESLESAQQGLRVSVLDRAAPPSTTETTRTKFLVLAAVVSLLLAALAAFLLEIRDPVIVDEAEVESSFDLPILGSVPRII